MSAQAHSETRSKLARLIHARVTGGNPSGSLATHSDTVSAAIRRLRAISFALSFLPAGPVIMTYLIVPHGTPQRDAIGSVMWILFAGMLVSLAVHLVLRNDRISLARRLDIGFAYQVIIALMLAEWRHFTPWGPDAGVREVSPVAMIIVIFAALIPNKPRRTFAVSAVSASMDTVGFLGSIAHGNPVPAPWQILMLLGGPFVATVVATVISNVVYGLARSADEAHTMGSYELIEKLGGGGMGEVWRARHRFLARPAAIKLIRSEAAEDPGAVRRFEREAQATSALRDPHTIQLYDFGVADDGAFYYVMELLEGLDLDKLVNRYGPQPAERVVFILSQVCASLDEAHANGLVHRDIKPANIVLSRYGRQLDFAKVLDFGLVKPKPIETNDTDAPTQTIDGKLAGTPAYFAPELALDEKNVDGRADIYALGCVGYWLLTGKLVFDGDTAMKLILAHAHTRPVAPSLRTDNPIPEALDLLILDCLEKDRERRPKNAAVFAERLAAVPLAAEWTPAKREAFWKEVDAGSKKQPAPQKPTNDIALLETQAAP